MTDEIAHYEDIAYPGHALPSRIPTAWPRSPRSSDWTPCRRPAAGCWSSAAATAATCCRWRSACRGRPSWGSTCRLPRSTSPAGARRAAEHGLQYLAEAQFLEMQTGMLPEDLREELFGDGCGDVLRAEQLLDYLKVRRFRQTLLCGAALEIDRDVSIERIGRLSVSSPASATVQDADQPGRVTFEAPRGSRLTTDHELVVAALVRITRAWPAVERVEKLVCDADSDDARAVLCETLMRCYAGNVVQLHVHPARLVSAAGEHPRASPLARLQAAERGPVATLLHGTIRVDDEFDRLVLGLLDGTRDRSALHAELRAVTDIDELAERIETSLQQLARAALLLA